MIFTEDSSEISQKSLSGVSRRISCGIDSTVPSVVSPGMPYGIPRIISSGSPTEDHSEVLWEFLSVISELSSSIPSGFSSTDELTEIL